MTQQDQAFLTRLVASARLAEGPLAEPDVGPKEKKTATAIESTYATLRDRILRGSHPQGSRLHLETLKSSLGVSGSTLREALTRLIGDRLVVAEGQKGFKVAPMSLCDLDDLTSARITLETTAIVESINLGGGDWEDQLVISFRRLARAQERVEANPGEAFDAWEARNQEFHNAERYRRLSGTQGPIPVEVHEEHKTIFEAAIARDANQAVLVLSQHIRRSANVIRANGLLREA